MSNEDNNVIFTLRVTERQKNEFKELQRKFGKTQKDLLASMLLSLQVSQPDRYKTRIDTLEKLFGSISAEMSALIKEADADVAVAQSKYMKMQNDKNLLLSENDKLQKKCDELERQLEQKEKEIGRLQFALDKIQEGSR